MPPFGLETTNPIGHCGTSSRKLRCERQPDNAEHERQAVALFFVAQSFPFETTLNGLRPMRSSARARIAVKTEQGARGLSRGVFRRKLSVLRLLNRSPPTALARHWRLEPMCGRKRGSGRTRLMDSLGLFDGLTICIVNFPTHPTKERAYHRRASDPDDHFGTVQNL